MNTGKRKVGATCSRFSSRARWQGVAPLPRTFHAIHAAALNDQPPPPLISGLRGPAGDRRHWTLPFLVTDAPLVPVSRATWSVQAAPALSRRATRAGQRPRTWTRRGACLHQTVSAGNEPLWPAPPHCQCRPPPQQQPAPPRPRATRRPPARQPV